jgi:hypothetical protein
MERGPDVNISSHSIDNFLECNRLQIGFALGAEWD